MLLGGIATGSAAGLALAWRWDMAIDLHQRGGGQVPPPLRVVTSLGL